MGRRTWYHSNPPPSDTMLLLLKSLRVLIHVFHPTTVLEMTLGGSLFDMMRWLVIDRDVKVRAKSITTYHNQPISPHDDRMPREVLPDIRIIPLDQMRAGNALGCGEICSWFPYGFFIPQPS